MKVRTRQFYNCTMKYCKRTLTFAFATKTAENYLILSRVSSRCLTAFEIIGRRTKEVVRREFFPFLCFVRIDESEWVFNQVRTVVRSSDKESRTYIPRAIAGRKCWKPIEDGQDAWYQPAATSSSLLVFTHVSTHVARERYARMYIYIRVFYTLYVTMWLG